MSRAGWSFVFALAPLLAFAQGTPPIDDQQPRVIVVPVPGEAPPDAGVAQAPPPPPAPPPEPVNNVPPPPPTPTPAPTPPEHNVTAQPDRPVNTPPPAEPQPSQTLLPPENPNPDGGPVPVGAMLDGHPREGSFLSGPGSFFFVMHHTLMGSLGVLATQMVPRAIRGLRTVSAMYPPYDAFNDDARIAYLVGALVGAGVGFASSAAWQFFNWINYTTATFGLINSVVGAMFFIGATNLFTQDATPISWMGLVGALSGAWLTAIVGGGDMPLNKGILITTGAIWATLYASCILGIFAAASNSANLGAGFDTVLIAPAIGAGALAIASLKFNPSTEQIVRANIFGGGVGIAVLLLSALVVPQHFNSPIPYALAGLTAAGAQTIVSILWVDTIASPASPVIPGTTPNAPSGLSTLYRDPENHKPYSRVWW